MKNENIIVTLGFLLLCLFGILVIGLGIGFTYWIGTSDLPDWVKFLILR